MMKLMMLKKQNASAASSSREPGSAFTDDDVGAAGIELAVRVLIKA